MALRPSARDRRTCLSSQEIPSEPGDPLFSFPSQATQERNTHFGVAELVAELSDLAAQFLRRQAVLTGAAGHEASRAQGDDSGQVALAADDQDGGDDGGRHSDRHLAAGAQSARRLLEKVSHFPSSGKCVFTQSKRATSCPFYETLSKKLIYITYGRRCQ